MDLCAVIGGIIVILTIAFIWWKKIKAQKNKEAKQTEEILKAPLEKYDDPAETLAEKYSQDGEKPINKL